MAAEGRTDECYGIAAIYSPTSMLGQSLSTSWTWPVLEQEEIETISNERFFSPPQQLPATEVRGKVCELPLNSSGSDRIPSKRPG